MSTFILGSTGLVGLQILKYAEQSALIDKIVTVSRRVPSITSPKIRAIEETDTDKWPEVIENETDTKVFFSGFGTTRSAAGGAENFKKIDYGVNYAAAKAAKKAGVETFVLISSVGANPNSLFFYLKVKGQLENDIIDLGFPRTIILRPGVLLGDRDKPKNFLNNASAGVAKFFHQSKLAGLLSHPVYGSEVAQVAVQLAVEPPSKTNEVKIVESGEICALAKASAK